MIVQWPGGSQGPGRWLADSPPISGCNASTAMLSTRALGKTVIPPALGICWSKGHVPKRGVDYHNLHSITPYPINQVDQIHPILYVNAKVGIYSFPYPAIQLPRIVPGAVENTVLSNFSKEGVENTALACFSKAVYFSSVL